MGGSAFTVGPDPLDTPRMPPDIYGAVKAHCCAKLQQLFACVASPIEGPGKTDYGDIDILVAWPKNTFTDKAVALNTIRDTLQAHRAILALGETSANFAIPWPEDSVPLRRPSRYIQVDVRICETLQALEWILFKHAHGDIWNILGSMIRPYGLTIDEEALYIRVPEVENSNRKRSKVYLTDEPIEILHFLDLPLSDCWEKPFRTRQEMFEYAAQCRLFWVKPVEPSNPLDATEMDIVDGETEKDRAALKSNDRRRMNYRPTFRAWIDDFVSECRRQGQYSTKPTTREDVTEEALERFGVRAEFDRRRHDFIQERQRDKIVKLIKAVAKEASPGDTRAITYRSCQVKALKRIIFEGDERYGIEISKEKLMDKDGFYREDEVQVFLAEHGDQVGEAALARHQQSFLARTTINITKD